MMLINEFNKYMSEELNNVITEVSRLDEEALLNLVERLACVLQDGDYFEIPRSFEPWLATQDRKTWVAVLKTAVDQLSFLNA
jgi:hypothetical protein